MNREIYWYKYCALQASLVFEFLNWLLSYWQSSLIKTNPLLLILFDASLYIDKMSYLDDHYICIQSKYTLTYHIHAFICFVRDDTLQYAEWRLYRTQTWIFWSPFKEIQSWLISCQRRVNIAPFVRPWSVRRRCGFNQTERQSFLDPKLQRKTSWLLYNEFSSNYDKYSSIDSSHTLYLFCPASNSIRFLSSSKIQTPNEMENLC